MLSSGPFLKQHWLSGIPPGLSNGSDFNSEQQEAAADDWPCISTRAVHASTDPAWNTIVKMRTMATSLRIISVWR